MAVLRRQDAAEAIEAVGGPLLPSSRWPNFSRKAYWQTLNFAGKKLL